MSLNSTNWTRSPLGTVKIGRNSWSVVGLNRDGVAFAAEIVMTRPNGMVSNNRICVEMPQELTRANWKHAVSEALEALDVLSKTVSRRLPS